MKILSGQSAKRFISKRTQEDLYKLKSRRADLYDAYQDEIQANDQFARDYIYTHREVGMVL